MVRARSDADTLIAMSHSARPGSGEHELLIDYRSPDGERVHAVRSTLIASSIATLKELGYYDRYLELLPPEHHERILLTLAPEWLPIAIGEAHYRACDGVGLSDAELEKLGEVVSVRIMGTFLGTLVRTSGQNLGATPWVPLAKYDLLWSRVMQGGRCTVERVGPKDVVIKSYGNPLFETRYFRIAYHGVVRGALGMFSSRIMGRTVRMPDAPDAVITSISWV